MLDRDYYLKKKNGDNLYINILENGKHLPNILFIQTPITTVVDLKDTYLPLSKYGFNVFALDLSGSGRSDGNIEQFSLTRVNEDLSLCIDFILEHYNDVIHFYAGHGIGGMLAQYYLSQRRPIRSFAQYGVVIPGDMSIAKRPLLIKLAYPGIVFIRKWAPKLKIHFGQIANMRGYKGKNAEKENLWYEEIMRRNSGLLQMPVAFLASLLELFLDKKSDLMNKPQCPVLFFAPKHDRYTDFSYFEKYYKWLDEPKEMYIIDDSHLSFVWHADELCKVACEWFHRYGG